jgi:hypothetical protein
MSAWVLALCCLLSTDVSLVRTSLPNARLAVYLSVGPNQPAAPLEQMKRELTGLMQAAGYQVIWQDPRSPDKTGETSALVVLELRGSCGLPPGYYHAERSVDSGASLAETSVTEQGVLPFSWVNCANLSRMIGPALSNEAPGQRDYLYGRAIARVVAHELYHVMMGSRDHGHEGVAKPRFTTSELLNERFDFDHASLAKLRQRAVDSEINSDSEPATGR